MIRVSPGGYSHAGMNDPMRQRRVLRAIADTLKSPRNRDLLPVFRDCPALLSVYGREMVVALRAAPRHWDLLIPYVVYLGKRYYRNHGSSWRACARYEVRRRLIERMQRAAPDFVRASLHRIRRAVRPRQG